MVQRRNFSKMVEITRSPQTTLQGPPTQGSISAYLWSVYTWSTDITHYLRTVTVHFWSFTPKTTIRQSKDFSCCCDASACIKFRRHGQKSNAYHITKLATKTTNTVSVQNHYPFDFEVVWQDRRKVGAWRMPDEAGNCERISKWLNALGYIRHILPSHIKPRMNTLIS